MPWPIVDRHGRTVFSQGEVTALKAALSLSVLVVNRQLAEEWARIVAT